jgi:hypothetical protein
LANATTTYAQAAYGYANTTEIYAEAAYAQANTNASNITVIQGVNTSQNTTISNLTTYAQAAYGLANATTTYAQASYALANATTTYAQAAYGYANTTEIYAEAAYGKANTNAGAIAVIQGVNDSQNTNISNVNTYAQAAYGLANATTTYAQAAYSQANSKATVYNTSSAPTSPSVDDIWIDPNSGIEYVYISSNSASQWVEFSAIGTPQNATANLQFVDQTIFATDNTRDIQILNPGTGNIVMSAASTIISGNLIANAGGATATFNNIGAAYFRVNTATIQANSAAINIVGSIGYYTQQPTSNGYMMQITGLDDTTTRVVADSASTDGSAYSAFIGRKARGTHQNPTAAQNGDTLAKFTGNGYGTTGYGVNAGGASIEMVATENYTDVARGASLIVSTTTPGSNVRTVTATFASNNITMTGNVIANTTNSISSFYNLNIGGSLTYAYQIDTANTTQYINYNTQELQLVPITGTTTLVHQNLFAGRKVVVVVTNTSGSDQTINLGIPINNCTATRGRNGNYGSPANTATVFSGTTAFFTFYSFDSSTSNVYCSITPT